MEVRLAKTAGFCFGVKRAVDTVYQQVEQCKNEKIYTFGPIIHNEEVVKDLRSKGVVVIETEDELRKLTSGVVIIRSHGVSKHIHNILEDQGLKCVDATCPFVKRIHKIVQEHIDNGYKIIIVGDKNHPEVIGINGWCKNNAIIARDISDINGKIESSSKVCLVCQTTKDRPSFEKISD